MTPNGTLLATNVPSDGKKLRDQAAQVAIQWKMCESVTKADNARQYHGEVRQTDLHK